MNTEKSNNMTQIPDSLQKLRDELRPKDLHFRPECEDFKCGAHKSYNEGFDAACAELLPVIEEMRKVMRHTCVCPRSVCVRKILSHSDYVVGCHCGLEKALAAADKILGEK